LLLCLYLGFDDGLKLPQSWRPRRLPVLSNNVTGANSSLSAESFRDAFLSQSTTISNLVGHYALLNPSGIR
jgi:hypothetical protein